MNFRTLFHYISYLQYPFMFIGLFFALSPYFQGIEHLKDNPDLMFNNLNSTLIFMGLGVGFSSLQDTTKTQNKFSKKIWENPRKGKIMISLIASMIFLLLMFGLIGYFVTEKGILNDLSIGIIVFGLGMFGF